MYAIREHIYRVKEDTKNDDGVRVSSSILHVFLYSHSPVYIRRLFFQKNQAVTSHESSFFARDIQNNIRVSSFSCQLITENNNQFFSSQTMAHFEKEIFDMIRVNAQLIESIQNQALGKDDSNSIDHSRL